MSKLIKMDKFISDATALGVPGLLLVLSMKFTGLRGAARLTTALKALGIGNMYRGLFFLGAFGLGAKHITDFSFDFIATAVLKQLYRQGDTKESIFNKIEQYPISSSLKSKLREEIEKIECLEEPEVAES